MTTLKDKIHDIIMDYEKDLESGSEYTLNALEEAIIEEIKDYFETILN